MTNVGVNHPSRNVSAIVILSNTDQIYLSNIKSNDRCRLVLTDSPASLGLNKSNQFRLKSTPLSQNALLLLVSGKMSPNLT